jgi:hypothetical protein
VAEVPRAALRAGAVLRPAAQGAEEAAPQAVRGAAEVLPEARRAEAAPEERRAGVGVAAQPVAAAEAQHVAAPGAPVALLSGVVWVFRRDPLRRLAPSRQARFARATARLRSASP